MLEGDDGVVIVDCMESAEAAWPVKEALHNVTIAGIFEAMAVKLNPEKSADVDKEGGTLKIAKFLSLFK